MNLSDIKEKSNKEFLIVETCSNQRLMELGIVPGVSFTVVSVNRIGYILHIIGSGSQIALTSDSAGCIDIS